MKKILSVIQKLSKNIFFSMQTKMIISNIKFISNHKFIAQDTIKHLLVRQAFDIIN